MKIKILIIILGFSTAIGCTCFTLLCLYMVLIYNKVLLIEPNKFVLIIEIFVCSIGLVCIFYLLNNENIEAF